MIALVIDQKVYEIAPGNCIQISDLTEFATARPVVRNPVDCKAREMAILVLVRAALETAETSQL